MQIWHRLIGQDWHQLDSGWNTHARLNKHRWRHVMSSQDHTHLNFGYPKQSDIENAVSNETSNVESNEIEIKTDHTPPIYVQEYLFGRGKSHMTIMCMSCDGHLRIEWYAPGYKVYPSYYSNDNIKRLPMYYSNCSCQMVQTETERHFFVIYRILITN